MLPIPIGTTAGRQVVAIDLDAPRDGGIGPHGLCIGDTGSGKTTFLRTLVASACATHRPDRLSWVLAGTRAINRLGDVPHIVDTIAGDPHDVFVRLRDATASELDRRERLFDAADAKDPREYRAQQAAAGLEPLPTLVVVFADLDVVAHACPQIVDVLGRVLRQGRSLGVHAVVSTASFDVVDSPTVAPHFGYTVLLRTSQAQSRRLLSTTAASELTDPGKAILATSDGALTHFRLASSPA